MAVLVLQRILETVRRQQSSGAAWKAAAACLAQRHHGCIWQRRFAVLASQLQLPLTSAGQLQQCVHKWFPDMSATEAERFCTSAAESLQVRKKIHYL